MSLKHILLFTTFGLVIINSYANADPSGAQDKSESTVKNYDLIPRAEANKEKPDSLLERNSESPLSSHSKHEELRNESSSLESMGKWPPEDPSWQPK